MWSLLPLPLLPLLPLAVALVPPPQTFVNTAVARTVELGGSASHVTTQYNVKATADGPGEYHLALGGDDDEEPAWWEVLVGGKSVDGVVLVSEPGSAPTVSVPLGKLSKDDTATISLSTTLVHGSQPLPAEIEQRDAQFLLWLANSTYVESWYSSDVERIKVRAPTPNIISHSTVPTTYTRDSDVTKSAATLTLGPFYSVPSTLGPKSTVERHPFTVHYEVKDPVMSVRTLKRSVEVSHWGANLNIQDEVDLANTGAKLKGHFSRLAHQQSRYHASTPAQIFTETTLRIPPTAHSVYYYDTIGNVSTSHFRAGSTPALQKKSKVRTSPRVVDGHLELRPRYPILGGWNYSFVVGWDMPLADALKTDGNKMVLEVPFLTPIRDAVVDDAELHVILPEGASHVEVFTPFPVDSIAHSVHKTYLDSTGRYMVTLTKSRLTEFHAQPIYITYEYSLAAQLQKPLTVAAVVGGLFVLFAGLRRVDYSIDSSKKA